MAKIKGLTAEAKVKKYTTAAKLKDTQKDVADYQSGRSVHLAGSATAAGNVNGGFCRVRGIISPIDPEVPNIKSQVNLPTACHSPGGARHLFFHLPSERSAGKLTLSGPVVGVPADHFATVLWGNQQTLL
jgi:hypothetical protein